MQMLTSGIHARALVPSSTLWINTFVGQRWPSTHTYKQAQMFLVSFDHDVHVQQGVFLRQDLLASMCLLRRLCVIGHHTTMALFCQQMVIIVSFEVLQIRTLGL